MKERLINFLTRLKENTKSTMPFKLLNSSIAIAIAGILLSLITYKISRDLSSAVSVLVATVLLLLALNMIFNNDKRGTDKELYNSHYLFLNRLVSLLLSGESYKSSMIKASEYLNESQLKENVIQAVDTAGQVDKVDVLFQINSKDRNGFEINGLLQKGFLIKTEREAYVIELFQAYEKYGETYIDSGKSLSHYFSSLNLSAFLCYLVFFMYEAVVNL